MVEITIIGARVVGFAVATELAARGLAARDSLPGLTGVRGEMLRLFCPEISLFRTVRLLHPRTPIYLVPRGDGHCML